MSMGRHAAVRPARSGKARLQLVRHEGPPLRTTTKDAGNEQCAKFEIPVRRTDFKQPVALDPQHFIGACVHRAHGGRSMDRLMDCFIQTSTQPLFLCFALFC